VVTDAAMKKGGEGISFGARGPAAWKETDIHGAVLLLMPGAKTPDEWPRMATHLRAGQQRSALAERSKYNQ
jgi:hypothetical protein